MKKLWRGIRRKCWALSHRRTVQALLKSAHTGDLADIGWSASYKAKRAMDGSGNPLPWFSYAAIHLLKQRLPADARVFEYGSGQSTLFFAARAAQVVSVEHDAAWAGEVQSKLPANARLLHVPLGDDYVQVADRFEPGSFDLVIVDGRKRVRCAEHARRLLSPRGVMILDDAQRTYYAPAYTALRAANFSVLELYGLAPGEHEHKLTTLFYRPGNLFGL